MNNSTHFIRSFPLDSYHKSKYIYNVYNLYINIVSTLSVKILLLKHHRRIYTLLFTDTNALQTKKTRIFTFWRKLGTLGLKIFINMSLRNLGLGDKSREEKTSRFANKRKQKRAQRHRSDGFMVGKDMDSLEDDKHWNNSPNPSNWRNSVIQSTSLDLIHFLNLTKFWRLGLRSHERKLKASILISTLRAG
jgi:hypothetical protein